MLVSGHVGEGQMNHLVGELPILIQLHNGCTFAGGNVDIPAVVGISDSAVYASPAAHPHIEIQMGNRKPAVVGANRIAGATNPRQQIGASYDTGFSVKADVDGGTAGIHNRRRPS